MRIRIVANNCKWDSWESKVHELKEWFAPVVDIDFHIVHTQFDDIPFTDYSSVDPAQNKLPNLQGVDPDWYDEHILPYGVGFDVVLLVLPVSQWKGKNARGWRADADVAIELQLGADEHEEMTWTNYPSMNAFYQLARHEIMHALYMISGQWDATHFYWNIGRLDMARDSVKLPQNYSFPIIMRAINYITKQVNSYMMKDTPIPPASAPDLLYKVAKESLGMDVSPNDLAPDELGCAETVSNLIQKVDPTFPIITGTWTLGAKMKADNRFERIYVPEKGCIVICMTGTGNGSMVGHTGIYMGGGVIASNESFGKKKGQFVENFTMESWRNRYEDRGGFETLFFRLK